MSDARVVLITGGGGGMGRAIAARFLEAGAKVAISDLDPKRVESISRELGSARHPGRRHQGRRLPAHGAGDGGAVRPARRAGRRGRHLDRGPADHATEAEWDKVIDVNLKGVFFANRYAIPELEKTKGIIVNIASDAGLTGNAGAAIYCASKGGVVILTKALAVELAPRGIRALAICPGDVETPMLAYQASAFGGGNPKGYLENLRTKYPQGAGAALHPAGGGWRAGLHGLLAAPGRADGCRDPVRFRAYRGKLTDAARARADRADDRGCGCRGVPAPRAAVRGRDARGGRGDAPTARRSRLARARPPGPLAEALDGELRVPAVDDGGPYLGKRASWAASTRPAGP